MRGTSITTRVDDEALRAMSRTLSTAYDNCQDPTTHEVLHGCDTDQVTITLFDIRQVVDDLLDLRAAVTGPVASVSCTCSKGGGILDMTKPGKHHNDTCPMRFDPDEIPF